MKDGPGAGDPEAILSLADWRRTIATLYADVRRLAADDPAAGLEHWRAVREDLYRHHPRSPILPAERATFRARHFAHDPALRFEVAVEPIGSVVEDGPRPGRSIDFGTGPAVGLPVSGGGSMAFERFGAVTIPFAEEPRRLDLFWMEGYAGGLFLPFRDATNGVETYGAGRYLLDGAKSADLGGNRGAAGGSTTLILDFNFAFQPSCAFDPQYACPLSPPSNRLDVPIRAGERLA
ncbi:MAG TPA: DUF1684 domain-containing protein [Patescibacteria group bacterium]|nr:DUF1684 domain-containing protein [Patescibacteria group bacterium]